MTDVARDGEDIVVRDLPNPAELRELGARWDPKRGAWALPATALNAKLVASTLPGLPPVSVDLSAPRVILDSRLYEYQCAAADRLVAAKHGMLLCLSPGLGKTAVSIVAADYAVPDDRVVVIAPASLLRTWEREIAKWSTDPRVYVMDGRPDFDAARSARWIVTSWDRAARDASLWGLGWPLFILDESVLAKSRGSKRFKAMAKIRKSVKRVWLLSGSPTTRYADDLWAQLHLAWPRAFPSYWRFAERYCVVEETPWARVVAGNRSSVSAAEDNADLVLVVNQEDVLALPPYLNEPPLVARLAGEQLRAYEQMARDFVADLGGGGQLVAQNEIARLLQLQRIASYWQGESAKHDVLLEALPRYEPPYLVWTHWREGAGVLADRVVGDLGIDAVHVAGDTPLKQRDSVIEGFKRGDYAALVLSMGVGKFGHTLTNVRTMVSLDRNFNADDYFQSMHRVRRIGLDHSPVVLPVVAAGTVDELTVGDNLEAKLAGISQMTRADLASLLKGMGR